MKVRDKLQGEKEYGGRPTEARDILCPCRPCWHPHDLGTEEKVYKNGVHVRSITHPNMVCMTRYRAGCPTPIELPVHVTTPHNRKMCRRCGQKAALLVTLDDQRRAAEMNGAHREEPSQP